MFADSWTTCTLGHKHWGRYGAAGLLIGTSEQGRVRVLLQHRAPWSHGGDTWGVPGGAISRGETPTEAALRETVEETRLDVEQLELGRAHVDDHGSWSYTTIIAVAPAELPVRLDAESVELRWVPVQEVAGYPLHPAFAAAWPTLQLWLERELHSR